MNWSTSLSSIPFWKELCFEEQLLAVAKHSTESSWWPELVDLHWFSPDSTGNSKVSYLCCMPWHKWCLLPCHTASAPSYPKAKTCQNVWDSNASLALTSYPLWQLPLIKVMRKTHKPMKGFLNIKLALYGFSIVCCFVHENVFYNALLSASRSFKRIHFSLSEQTA